MSILQWIGIGVVVAIVGTLVLVGWAACALAGKIDDEAGNGG